eukprot:c45117_g1_i1 orf=22-249(-)
MHILEVSFSDVGVFGWLCMVPIKDNYSKICSIYTSLVYKNLESYLCVYKGFVCVGKGELPCWMFDILYMYKGLEI